MALVDTFNRFRFKLVGVEGCIMQIEEIEEPNVYTLRDLGREIEE